MHENARKGGAARPQRAGKAGPRCSRRRVRAGAAAAALLPALPPAVTVAAGEPFADGSRFADDGTGWVA